MKRSANDRNDASHSKKWDFLSVGSNFNEIERADDELYVMNEQHIETDEKFGYTRSINEFTINPKTAHPDQRLHDVIEKIIEQSIQKTEQRGKGKVNKFGVKITGKGLNNAVYLPYRPFPQNSADTVIGEISKLGQSDGQEGGKDKRTILLSHPVQMMITCIVLPNRKGPRNVHKFNFGFNENRRLQIRNRDKFCLFYALAASKQYLELHRSSHHRFMNNLARQRDAALDLLRNSGISEHEDNYGIEHLPSIQNHWDLTHPGRYRIVAFESSADPKKSIRVIWNGPMGRDLVVPIFLDKKHWDGLKNYVRFFNRGRKYCIDCECFYSHDSYHTVDCKARCYYCNRVGQIPCKREADVKIECPNCRRIFFNNLCYEYHRHHQTCNLWKRCTACNKTFQNNPKRKHECGDTFCQMCNVAHNPKRGCFIKPVNSDDGKYVYRIVVWDSETSQDKIYKDDQREHIVNYISARVACTKCCDNICQTNCEICGPERIKDWSEADGDDPTKNFVDWIMNAFDKRHSTYVFAHNAGRFDGHFVFNYLCRTGKSPIPLINGLKIYEFTVQNSARHSKLIWRDSCLLMPVKLESLKATFNLDCEDKPFFPYYFNKRQNYGVHLTHLPPIEDYSPGSMKYDKHDKFERWYNENFNSPFYLPDELKSYCRNDTEILLKSIVEFRRILINDITGGFDPLPRSCTNAGIAMNIFKALFLQDEELAIVPERGFERCDRASVLAIKYLEWRSKKDGVVIRHAGNGREVQVGRFKLDGFIERQNGNKCIEVMGCFMHGCLVCYDPKDLLIGDRCAQELNDETQERLVALRMSLVVEEVWECQIQMELKNNPEMREFFDDRGREKGPIDPRMAYAGGRTGPMKLFAKSDHRKKISVYDIISLYPAVNYETAYPVRTPEIIIPKPEEVEVNWVVQIIPPRGLKIPVLQLKCDERLLFPLCWRCASQFKKEDTRCDYQCSHTKRQRRFVSTYTSLELGKALECGYVVDRFYRAWHYSSKDWNDDLFKGYVRLFLKLKEEASGFPAGVETDEHKRRWANEYKEKYGIEIDLNRVKKNPGLRYISKLMLNSLWGKFSMRNSLCKNRVIDRPSEFYQMVLDHKIEIHDLVKYSEGAIRVIYKDKTDFVAEHGSSNIVVSLWTTSIARLKLLQFMQEAERNGAEILYTDTDSIFVLHDRDSIPINTGKYLGEMSEEYSGYEIEEFCCGGAKQYGMKLRDRRSGDIEFILKIRGITFDVQNQNSLHYATFKEMVLNFGQEMDPAFFLYRTDFGPTKESRIVTREKHKIYFPVCRKGIINQHLEVLPFGF